VPDAPKRAQSRTAWLTLPAGQTTATIPLDLASNDFSQDLSGWTVSATYAFPILARSLSVTVFAVFAVRPSVSVPHQCG